ncbi:MAG: carboxypeptidase regulatory-like domain-containing protein [Bacteroidales bacterium]|nr:carboxypeptidase regulatory-like domain-containing protein [Bacteroidales bacterium]
MKRWTWGLMVFAFLTIGHKAWAQIAVSGNVFEQDSITPIEAASVTFSGISVSGDTLVYQFVTDALGQYSDSLTAGTYRVWASAEGYATTYLEDSLLLEEGQAQEAVSFILYELLHPVRYVEARLFTDELVRIRWSMNDSIPHGDSTKITRSFQYYDLFRSRIEEAPVLMASHLTDTVFMDMNWSGLPWGQYRWGVSCYYEGNRSYSDTIWSAYLDKDMTTTFTLDATTNVGLSPAGATVLLSSQDHSYQATLDGDGHVLMPDVYRDAYDVRVHLDGFVDYVSDSAVSVFEPTHVEIELIEATNGIDSLYVSSTGWAIWSLEGTHNRDLQYFEIMLNGEAAGQTINTFFQFEVGGLAAGDTCTAQVRPVYLSETGAWKTCQWVYRPCTDFAGPTNLTWVLDGEALHLSWDYPEGDFVGAILYRNGEFLAFTEEDNYLDETVELHGEVEYCLRLVYDGPTDGTYYSMSCEQCTVAVFPAYCDPPVKLDGIRYFEDENDHGALVSWGERPEPINEWLYYDNGTFKRSLGGDNDPRIFWAIRFEAEDLADYIGTHLRKVSLYDVGAGTYQLWIYVGGDTAPRTLVRSQNMVLTNAQAWHEEIISPAYDIPENEPLWIVVGQQGLSRPAAACQDMGNPNGRWVSLDGETWTDMHIYNMHYTWMLRAFVTNQAGREMALGKEGYILQQYKLYRSFDNADYEQVASIPAIESQLYYEYRDNLADDDYEDVYYRLTAYYLADNGETCESDYATTLNDPEQNYVAIDLTSTEENLASSLKLYPNPTNGCITIELEGLQKVMVYNALGQVLLSKEADGDALQLNLSRFGNGLYWASVMTQNGVVTRRFVLSR